MNNFMKITIVGFFMLFITGCATNNLIITNNNERVNLSSTIVNIAEQLQKSSRLANEPSGTIAITSFVDLNKFSKTTPFGRILAESMFNELFIRGFNVADFRGKEAITITKNGEFYITRDVGKLKDEVPNTYVLVGTYSKIDDKILLNVRIMDNITGKVVASARSIYDSEYCMLKDDVCTKKPHIKRKIKIVTDDMETLM